MIRNLKLEKEAQATNYKEKLKQINAQNLHTISILQSQLDDAKEEIDKLNKKISELRSINGNTNGSRHEAKNDNAVSPLSINVSYSQQQSNKSSPGVNSGDYGNNIILKAIELQGEVRFNILSLK